MKIKQVICFFWRHFVVNVYELLADTSLINLRNYSYIVDNSDLLGIGYTSLTAAKRAIDSQHTKENRKC